MVNSLHHGSPTFLCFAAIITMHYLCRGQMLAVKSPMFDSAVQFLGHREKNEVSDLNQVQSGEKGIGAISKHHITFKLYALFPHPLEPDWVGNRGRSCP